MRVLLDEQIDWRLARAFGPEHDVDTVRGRGWLGKENGVLLRAAAAEYDALVTMDRGIEHQQNLAAYDLVVVLITARSNRRADVAPAIPEVLEVLASAKPGRLYRVAA
jgi:uncharacterized membrane protein